MTEYESEFFEEESEGLGPLFDDEDDLTSEDLEGVPLPGEEDA